jgi:hypothetical protein
MRPWSMPSSRHSPPHRPRGLGSRRGGTVARRRQDRTRPPAATRPAARSGRARPAARSPLRPGQPTGDSRTRRALKPAPDDTAKDKAQTVSPFVLTAERQTACATIGERLPPCWAPSAIASARGITMQRLTHGSRHSATARRRAQPSYPRRLGSGASNIGCVRRVVSRIPAASPAPCRYRGSHPPLRGPAIGGRITSPEAPLPSLTRRPPRCMWCPIGPRRATGSTRCHPASGGTDDCTSAPAAGYHHPTHRPNNAL